jgi:hypothetical protein
MDDFTVLEEKFVFENGCNYLHVMQVGEPVDLATVIAQKVPMQSQDWTLDNQYQEGRTIVRHHLEIFFPYRDVVRVRLPEWRDDSVFLKGVFWRRTDKSRMSAIIQDAADLFWGHYDKAPEWMFTQKLPKNAPSFLVLDGTCQGAQIMLRECDWMPRGCIIVCEHPDFGRPV